MTERILLGQGKQEPNIEGFYSFSNVQHVRPGTLSVTVEVTPGVDRRIDSTHPPTPCDRIKIAVGKSDPLDPTGHRDCLISALEIPVTEPPRTPAEFATLAQNLADLAVGHAGQVFGLYQNA